MPVSLAIKLTVVAVAGAAAASFVGNFQMAAPPPFETASTTLSNGRILEAGRDEITYALWKSCYGDRACEYLPSPPLADGQDYPVTRVNGQDIEQFLTWINTKTSSHWRLPTLAEWRELSAALPKPVVKKRFTDPRLAWAADYGTTKPLERELRPSGSFGALPNGLRDMGGNVFEWTSTCVNPDTGNFMCPAFYVMGEHDAEIPIFLRDPVTGGCTSGTPPTHLGFRLVRDS
jgi:formylglycine-generating enzyme required for sulfatase activity